MLMLNCKAISSTSNVKKTPHILKQIEAKGPRFEIGDFVVKLGNVTMSQTFKGVMIEVRNN